MNLINFIKKKCALMTPTTRLSLIFLIEWIKDFHVHKNIIYEKRIKERNSNFWILFLLPPLPPSLLFWVHIGITFVLGNWLEKIIFPLRSSIFLSSKKVQKNQDKNWICRYLPKIPFVPQRDKWSFSG